MGQVTVTVNGRTFKLGCADGEEARVLDLAGDVAERAQAIAEEFGPISDDRVLLLTAIMLADELAEARSRSDAGTEILMRQDGLVWGGSRKVAR
jgi:cell division protein ZapA